jgi:hypothetical protein
MADAILFKKCLGLNDARAMGSQRMVTNPRDPEAGNAELTDCLNLTTTPDGCLEKIAPFVTALTHTAPITNISAGKRFLFQDGTDTREWLGGATVVNRFSATAGPTVHTETDVRVSTASKVYKSVDPATAMTEALVGDYNGPPVSIPFVGMPPFDHAFEYNGRIYSVNHAMPGILQFSEPWEELWSLKNGRIDTCADIMQTGAIPGVIVTTHANGVTVYAGMDPLEPFAEKFYPCNAIDGTLYSGFVSKVYGHGHVFMCDDGVYLVGAEGTLVNLSVDQTAHLNTLNTSYTCATVQDGKYLAFGNALAVEYDFKTKSVLKRSSFGVKAATVWNKQNYYAVGSTVSTIGTAIDTTANFAASMTLPFSDMSAPGTKSVDSLYFTGTIGGEVAFTATDNVGKMWTVNVNSIGSVFNYRIKTPKGMLGNHISLNIACSSGAFRIEQLRATFAASQRSR